MRKKLLTLKTLLTDLKKLKVSSFGAREGPRIPPDLVDTIANKVNPYYNNKPRTARINTLKQLSYIEEHRLRKCREILNTIRNLLNRVHGNLFPGHANNDEMRPTIREFMNEIQEEDMHDDTIPLNIFGDLYQQLTNNGCLEDITRQLGFDINPGDNLPIIMLLFYRNRTALFI